MKYTAIINLQSVEIVAVKGCTTCPHAEKVSKVGETDHLQCTRGANGEKRKKKLLGNWTGGYHESCLLPNSAKPFAP